MVSLLIAASVLSPIGYAYGSGYGYANLRWPQSVLDRPSPISHLGPVTQVAISYGHALALKEDGRVMAWGSNTRGELGQGNFRRDIPQPATVKNLPPCVAIAAGPSFSLAITTTGEVYAWGENRARQLGPGAPPGRSARATLVPGLTGITGITAGNGFSAALTAAGEVFAWGSNYYGQLGDGTNVSRATPALVPGLSGALQVESGGLRCFAVLANGTVVGWGSNSLGGLGAGSSASSVLSPLPVLKLSHVAKVSAGVRHALAMLETGEVASWGANEYGELGCPGWPTSYAGHPRARVVPNLSDVADVSAENNASAVVQNNGKVLIFGRTNDSVPGIFKLRVPYEVPELKRVFDVEVGYWNTLAISQTETPIWLSREKGIITAGHEHDTMRLHTEKVLTTDLTVNLHSSFAKLIVPDNATIPAGTAVSEPFVVDAPFPVIKYINTVVTTAGTETGAGAMVTLVPESLTVLFNSPLEAGDPGYMLLRTNFVAPPQGLPLSIQVSHPNSLILPATAIVPAGTKQVSVPFQTAYNVLGRLIHIDARRGSLKGSSDIFLRGNWIHSVTQATSTVTGGQNHEVTVRLVKPAPVGGITVKLNAYPFDVTVPATVVVPEGERSVVVSATTPAVVDPTDATLTATVGAAKSKFVQYKIVP